MRRGFLGLDGGALALAALALAALVAGPAHADGASLGLAGAYSLRARGADAPSWNPATLAWSRTLDIRIAAAGGAIHNNSYSLDDYARWNGAVLSEGDKETILGRIPNGLFRGAFEAGADGPGGAWRGWAITTAGRAAGVAVLPGEYGRLVFYGNDPEQNYDFQGTAGDGTAWSEFRLSHGRDLGVTRIAGQPVAVAGGITVKLLRGFAHGEVTRASGSLVTTMDGISGAQEIQGRTAEGGSGLGCDLGLAARAGSWRFGLAVANAYSRLSWTRGTEEHTQRAWADSLTTRDLEGEDGVDLVTTADTTLAIGSFRTTLPAEFSLAVARPWRGFAWEIDYRQGFSDRAGTSKTPRLALGVSRSPWRFLDLRTGLAIGGDDGPVLAGGLGLAWWKLRCDLGVSSARGIDFTSPRGAEAGVSLGLRWGGAPLD